MHAGLPDSGLHGLDDGRHPPVKFARHLDGKRVLLDDQRGSQNASRCKAWASRLLSHISGHRRPIRLAIGKGPGSDPPVVYKAIATRRGQMPWPRRIFVWISAPVALTFESYWGECPPIALSSRRCEPAAPLLLPRPARHLSPPGPPWAQQGFKFSQPDDADRAGAGSAAEPHRRAAVHAVPGRPQGQEDHGRHRRGAVQRLHRRAAAELRSAFPGDQRAPARARACAPTRPRRSARRSRRPRSTPISSNDPDAALRGVEAARRELRPARPDLGAGRQRNPMMNVNQVSVNMGFTLTGSDGRHHFRRRRRARAPTRARTSRRWR